jgi:hypothetical protein
MSRDLPDRPDFDHLKKQAKALLRKLREWQPEATLADAQHALAREYGFASWPKLKTHLEASAAGNRGVDNRGTSAPPSGASSPAPLFNRFTEAAKRTLFFSRFEATALGRLVIGPEHVLLGVIRGASGASVGAFSAAGVTLDSARAAMAAANAPRDEIVEPVQVPFNPSTKALFPAAADEADRLGHSKIATIHLLLAVLRDTGIASSFLLDRGMTLDSVRAAAAVNGAAAQDDEANP